MALTISVIVLILFLADLLLGLFGMQELAPFSYTNMVMDIVYVICSLALTIMSWLTFREQV